MVPSPFVTCTLSAPSGQTSSSRTWIDVVASVAPDPGQEGRGAGAGASAESASSDSRIATTRSSTRREPLASHGPVRDIGALGTYVTGVALGVTAIVAVA